VATATALARVVVPAAGDGSAAVCERPRIGFMGPLTGDAAFVGKEQLGFARYAIRKLGRGQVRLIAGDTQLDPSRAAAVGAGFHKDAGVLAVVGPATNREVLAVAPTFKRAPRLVFVSASALNSALTNGSIPNFFRVVPNDDAQAPSTATYIRRTLKAKDVFVVDDRTTYSKLLANGVQAGLRAGGVRVTRSSVNQKVTDFSSLISAIGDEIDVVYLPWQIAANGQIFGQQLKAHGKQTVIFGGDGLDSGDFKIPGSYVSAFAPDVRGVKGNEAFIREYGARFASNFGPPAYVATQAAIAAIQKACADGEATRAEVQTKLKATRIPRIVLGGDLRFTARGDRKGATFSIFKLGARGKKTLVG
jgi:branched-chain amino acid transport system substrate-binding protein